MRKSALLLTIGCVLALIPTAHASHRGAAGPAQATRLAAPPDGQAYFGFTFLLFDTNEPIWGDARPFAERIRDSIDNELASKTPTFLNVWATWQHPDLPYKPLVPFGDALSDIAKVRAVVGERGTIYFDWNVTQTTPGNDGITTRDIASGALDGYIRRYAREIKDYGQPLLIRLFNGEFNGSWWYGVSPLANRSLTTRDFVEAWRRVVDIFRAVGVGNVSWAWVVNAYPAGFGQEGIDKDIGAYYPGDEYVDWVGADVYDVGAPDWLDGPYAFAVAHGKPVFIGEFGIRHEWSPLTTMQQRAWLEAIFDYFESHPAVKAISYFNLNNRRGGTRMAWDPARSVYIYDGRVNYAPDLNDHDSRLLAGGPETRSLFARRIASARYVSSTSTATVETQPQIATVALLAPSIRGRTAIIRWRGDLAADTFDLSVKRASGGWRTIVSGSPAKSHRIHGSRGERLRIRARAHDVYGVAGPWSAERTLRFGRG